MHARSTFNTKKYGTFRLLIIDLDEPNEHGYKEYIVQHEDAGGALVSSHIYQEEQQAIFHYTTKVVEYLALLEC